MSWAALLAKNKEEKGDFSSPQAVVYATDPELDEKDKRLENTEHATVSTVTLPQYRKGLLILDANALIKGMDNFNSVADAFVTTSQVVHEIRDKASKELMERLPHALTVLDPTSDSVRAVVHMAERTGDLGVLSRTDIRLCALALDCCKEGDCMLEAFEPRQLDVNPDADATVRVVVDAVTDEDEDSDEEDEDSEKDDGDHDARNVESASVPHEPKGTQAKKSSGAAQPDDDEEGDWITPENIHEMAADGTRNPKGSEGFTGGMACVTSDFAMQNTLMHLGVPIVGTNGMRIRELRLWMLRCTGCFTLVTDTTKQFCPACGSGDTLRRVNYVVNSDGERQLFINFKKQISTRGTIYNLPRPRGGKHGTNRTLVLREDQLAQVIRGSSGAKMKERQAISSFEADDELAGFGELPHKKKRNLADPKATSSYHRYNMNEKKKQRAGRKK